MLDYKRFTPEQFVLISTIIGIIIAKKLDANGQNVYGNVLIDIGQVLLTIAAEEQALQSQSDGNNSSSSNGDLQKQIDELQKQIDQLKGCL